MTLFNKKTVLITAAGLITGGLLLFLLLSQPVKAPRMAVLSVLPSSDAKNVGFFDPVKVMLDGKPDYFKLISLLADPELEFTATVSGQSIVYSHAKSFLPNTTYRLTVNQKGTEEPLAVWSFSTRQPQTDTKLLKKMDEIYREYYPLSPYLPIENKDFKIQYAGRLSLEIIIYTADVETAKQQAIDLIRSKGIDPLTHQISYIEIMK